MCRGERDQRDTGEQECVEMKEIREIRGSKNV